MVIIVRISWKLNYLVVTTHESVGVTSIASLVATIHDMKYSLHSLVIV